MVEHEKLRYGVVLENEKKYNIKLNNGIFLREEWFDTYKIEQDSQRCIFGYKKEELKYLYGGTDRFGKVTVEPIYEFLIFNEEDTYTVYKGDKSGYIDSRLGSEITPIIFKYAGRFKDGKAYVEYNELCGYISRNEWKLATADGIKYNFNLLKWMDENKEYIEEEKVKKLSL